MEGQLISVERLFQSDPCRISEFLQEVSWDPSPDTQTDFYSALSIASLATIPIHTKRTEAFPQIRIVDGVGATVSLARLLLGKQTTVAKFAASCKHLSCYIDENYATSIPCDSNVITAEDLMRSLVMMKSSRELSTSLSDNNISIKVLLLPAVACHDFTGTVYIHTPLSHTEQELNYTVILPQAIYSAPKSDIMNVFFNELAVCLSDKAIREKTCCIPPEITTCASQMSSVIIFCKTEPKSSAQRHLATIENMYRFIAERLCAAAGQNQAPIPPHNSRIAPSAQLSNP